MLTLRLRHLSVAPALLASIVIVMTTGCSKKATSTQVATAPQATVAPAPVITFKASPSAVNQGQATQLTWTTQNATDVQLQNIGPVATSGSRQVTPNASTTYTLVATGPGGTTQATTQVNVSLPAANNNTAPSQDLQTLFRQNVKDIFFGYDVSSLDTEDQQLVAADARFLQAHPGLKITIEGHCDERGSTEYNLALGSSRADAVRQALIAQGVQADRINTISYGKEKPFCEESTEECWHSNRRGHFALPQ